MRNIFNTISFPYRHFKASKINAPREEYLKLIRDVYGIKESILEPFSAEQLKNGLKPVHKKLNIMSFGLQTQMLIAAGFALVNPITIPAFALIFGVQGIIMNKLIENRKQEAHLYLALAEAVQMRKKNKI